MNRKLPDDAFTFYVSLGPARSYSAVANRFGVAKKTVTRAAQAEHWQERLAEIEAKAREGTQKKLVESLEEVNDRHLRMLRAVQQRALETLRAHPLKAAIDAVRALHDSIKNERVVLGEPGDRTALDVEDTIRREYARWMAEEHEDEDDDEVAAPALETDNGTALTIADPGVEDDLDDEGEADDGEHNP